MHLSGIGVTISGSEGFLLACAAGVWEMEKFVIPLVWAAPGTCAPGGPWGREGTVLSKKPWNDGGGVEKRMHTVCLSKQCFFFKIGLSHLLS